MRLSLKKFTEDPYRNIKHAPLILEVSGKPKYAIIPYSLYTYLRDQTPLIKPVKTNEPVIIKRESRFTWKPKLSLPARIHKLLFE